MAAAVYLACAIVVENDAKNLGGKMILPGYGGGWRFSFPYESAFSGCNWQLCNRGGVTSATHLKIFTPGLFYPAFIFFHSIFHFEFRKQETDLQYLQ